MISILLVAQAAASPVQGVFRVDDFPEYVLQAEKSYRIPTRTLIGPDGKAIWCDVEHPSSERRLDKHTCNIIMKRARFMPVKWIDGTPSHALYRQSISWTINYPMSGPTADLEVAVNKLPAGMKSPARMELSIAVDEHGKAVSCASAPPPSIKDVNWTDDPALARLACSELIKGWDFFVPKDPGGRALRTIQNFTVLIGEQRRN